MLLSKKTMIVLLALCCCIHGLYAQEEFPAGDFWALDAGMGMNGILVEGASFQFIIDPRLWLSPALLVGSKVGINISAEKNSDNSDLGNILTFEGQVYMRWNFLRLGDDENKKTNIFLQGGLGLISAYRGTKNPFNEVTETRGSVLAEAAFGATIPLNPRWHLEPQIFSGYPHLYGVSLTAGYKFPLPHKTEYRTLPGRTEFVPITRTLPAAGIVRHIMISAVEYILFGPDIGRYNIGIDNDAGQLNEMVLDTTARMLFDNPAYLVRIEGHANPYTYDVSEADELMTLSNMRANVVAQQLRGRGISDTQMVIVSFGGTRTVTSEEDWDIRNRNRRVELIIIQYDNDDTR